MTNKLRWIFFPKYLKTGIWLIKDGNAIRIDEMFKKDNKKKEWYIKISIPFSELKEK